MKGRRTRRKYSTPARAAGPQPCRASNAKQSKAKPSQAKWSQTKPRQIKHAGNFCLSRDSSKQASKQASERASERASEQASTKASERASERASTKASKQLARRPARKPARKTMITVLLDDEKLKKKKSPSARIKPGATHNHPKIACGSLCGHLSASNACFTQFWSS